MKPNISTMVITTGNSINARGYSDTCQICRYFTSLVSDLYELQKNPRDNKERVLAPVSTSKNNIYFEVKNALANQLDVLPEEARQPSLEEVEPAIKLGWHWNKYENKKYNVKILYKK